jgi:ABC-type Zn2+ transport system substrate-binding protein/surface adhesin
MRVKNLRLTAIVAFILVISIAVFSQAFSSLGENVGKIDMSVPQKIARVADHALKRSEVRIEREVKLENLIGFDPYLASFLRNPLERRIADKAAEVEQVASLSHERERGGGR